MEHLKQFYVISNPTLSKEIGSITQFVVNALLKLDHYMMQFLISFSLVIKLKLDDNGRLFMSFLCYKFLDLSCLNGRTPLI